jgi:hypothetical protein
MVFTRIFWEMGLAGFITYTLFYYFIFRDALILVKSSDLYGSLALGWTGVVLVLGIAMFYNDFISENFVNIPFWYFSGLLASRTFRMSAMTKEHVMREIQNSGPTLSVTVGRMKSGCTGF